MQHALCNIIFGTIALSAASITLADAAPTPVATKAIAVLMPTKDNTAAGTVTFTQTPEGVKIVADVTGLTPGKHGFHIHEFGDCSAPDAMSAGGHFNPTHEAHGGPDAQAHHAGDMGNLVADASGKAHYEYVDNSMSFSGPTCIIGHGVIVHKNLDDLTSQPVGNAGPRVACGVIGVAKP